MSVDDEPCHGRRLVRQAQAARVRHLLDEGYPTDEIARRLRLDEADVCALIEEAGWRR